MKKIKIYLSHSIRGKFGVNATPVQMNRNCKKAIRFGNWLRENFPNVELYIPGEHESWIQKAWMHRIITEQQILSVDCEIVSDCKGMIVFMFDGHISRGMLFEINYCKSHGIPYLTLPPKVLRSVKRRKKTIERFLKGLK